MAGNVVYDPDEMMVVAGARQISDGQVCFVGIGLPGRASILAKRHHAPNAVLVFESGVIDTSPTRVPLSIGDNDLAANSRTIVSLPEMFNYWLQGGRIDVGFIGAAQIDRFGNINTTVIGPYDRPTVRLPGSGGAPEIASCASETVVIMRHDRRALVESVDFITSVGHLDGGDARAELNLRGAGPTKLVTDLGVLTCDPETHEFVLTELYPGVDVDTALQRTGWELRIAPDLAEMPGPTPEERQVLRSIALA